MQWQLLKQLQLHLATIYGPGWCMCIIINCSAVSAFLNFKIQNKSSRHAAQPLLHGLSLLARDLVGIVTRVCCT
jgi:hypothetical protein